MSLFQNPIAILMIGQVVVMLLLVFFSFQVVSWNKIMVERYISDIANNVDFANQIRTRFAIEIMLLVALVLLQPVAVATMSSVTPATTQSVALEQLNLKEERNKKSVEHFLDATYKFSDIGELPAQLRDLRYSDFVTDFAKRKITAKNMLSTDEYSLFANTKIFYTINDVVSSTDSGVYFVTVMNATTNEPLESVALHFYFDDKGAISSLTKSLYFPKADNTNSYFTIGGE